MNRFRLLTAICALSLTICFSATADEENPIDKALDACLATPDGQTDAGQIDCTQKAINAWNVKLNQTYQSALSNLDPKSQGLLRASERQWVSFRNAERLAQGGPWRESHGTLINIEQMRDNLSAIKERTAELETYLAQ